MIKLQSEFIIGAHALNWLSKKEHGSELLSTLQTVLSEQSDQKNVQSTVDVELRDVAQKLCLERGLSEYFSNVLADRIVTYVNGVRTFIGTNPVYPGEAGRFLQ